jgi:hypothetical protein
MKVISFDIGIRNLAYCVLEGTDKKDVKIVDWNIVDLLSEQLGVEAKRCYKCPAAASWLHKTEGLSVCTRHKPKSKVKLTKTELSKRTIETIQAELKSLNLEVPTTKAKCVTLLFTHHKQNTWLRCVKSANSGSIHELSNSIVSAMDRLSLKWHNADIAVFENQMDRRMFAVQSMLHMYFVCRGFKCKGVSASHKLTNLLTEKDTTGTYGGRKKTGIAHTTTLVPAEWKTYFLKHSKKDDLADSFLQGLWALEHPTAL